MVKVKNIFFDKQIKTYDTGLVFELEDGTIMRESSTDVICPYYVYQKPSPSSPETTDTPTENKQDFGEAIEIIRKFYISKLVAHQYSQHVHNVIYEKINDKYQRLLSILSSK